jgi:hypothetical protein
MKSKPKKKELAAPVKKQPKKRELNTSEKKQSKTKELHAAVKKQPKKTETPAVVKKKPQEKDLIAAEKKQPMVNEHADIVKEPPQKKIFPVELGTRYKCYKCGTKFYDLGRPEPLCPSCGVNQNNNEAKGINKRKKRPRSSTLVRTDYANTVLIDREDLIEVVSEVDAEYTLDIDDIVLEEHEDTDEE